MRRVCVAAGVWLATGFVLSWAIALVACNSQMPLAMAASQLSPGDRELWARFAPKGSGSEPTSVEVYQNAGARVANMYWSASPTAYPGDLQSVSAGWPAPCMSGYRTLPIGGGPVEREHAIWIFRFPISRSSGLAVTDPVWAGFLIDTIVLGAPAAVVIWLQGKLHRVRQARRTRSNRCAQCGYPTDSLATCPECGTPPIPPS